MTGGLILYFILINKSVEITPKRHIKELCYTDCHLFKAFLTSPLALVTVVRPSVSTVAPVSAFKIIKVGMPRTPNLELNFFKMYMQEIE